MSTNWKRLYGPTTATGTGAVAVLTSPANTAYVLTKLTVSNVTATAALATLSITPSGGAGLVQVWQKTIPGYPTTGSTMEVAELEGQILGAGDILTFTSGTANALSLMVSGVAYTP
tara:strand:- start:418 stop:765 length:348 start_codon:yes stop_codon:yes gene_type:complete